MELLKALAIGCMFGVGLYMVLRRNLVRSAIGLVLISNAVNLLLLTAGAFRGLHPSYTTLEGPRSDALPQALVLTAIVISMGGFVFILGMLYVVASRYRSVDMDDLRGLKH